MIVTVPDTDEDGDLVSVRDGELVFEGAVRDVEGLGVVDRRLSDDVCVGVCFVCVNVRDGVMKKKEKVGVCPSGESDMLTVLLKVKLKLRCVLVLGAEIVPDVDSEASSVAETELVARIWLGDAEAVGASGEREELLLLVRLVFVAEDSAVNDFVTVRDVDRVAVFASVSLFVKDAECVDVAVTSGDCVPRLRLLVTVTDFVFDSQFVIVIV